MKIPHLIQRCFIKQVPTCQYEGRIADFITLDYMGSAEFEFGAIPQTYTRMSIDRDKYKVSTISAIREDRENGTELRVFHSMNDQEFAQYEEFLIKLWNQGDKPFRFKESPYFRAEGRVNLWFDIDNGVMWSFDKKFMKHNIIAAMRRTFDKFAK